MTMIQTAPTHIPTRPRPTRIPARDDSRPVSRGPRQRRPGGAPPRYRGTAVLVSRAPHRRRPITPTATVGLAMLAALITVWLGVVAHFGGVVDGTQTSGRVPDRLAVVRVDAGESLQHLAARVAPGAPVAKVAQRIRELNDLNSPALAAGQTLIAPVG
jgi:hypothetical protein